MIATLPYRDRNTFIQQLDPRTRLLALLLLVFATVFTWDLRFVLPLFLLALLQFILARLTWRETRRFWIVISILILLLTTLTLLTGRGGVGVITSETPVWQGQVFGRTLSFSAERLMFALTQLLRLFTMALLSIIPFFTIHPAQYGIAFRRLGLPDNIAFALDLALRFVPSLGHDFATTLAAQRARGYELERAGGLLKAIRNTAPLVLPVTIGAILKSEDVIDAMNLHAFGTGPRTWVQQLRYGPADYAVLALCSALLITSLTLTALGRNGLWLPV